MNFLVRFCASILVVATSALYLSACGSTGNYNGPYPSSTSSTSSSGSSGLTSSSSSTSSTSSSSSTGSTSSTGSGGSGGAAPCAEGAVRCGETCADLTVDPKNCGACAQTCAEAEMCLGGVCQAPPPPPLATCTIYGGAGLEVLNELKLETDCHAACDGQAEAHPNRECAWAGTIFLPHALGMCLITGGAGLLLFAADMPMMETCSQECEIQTVTLNHPNARCKWAQHLLQEHALGVCLIKDGDLVLHQANDPSKAACSALCSQLELMHPNLSCAWAEDVLNPPQP